MTKIADMPIFGKKKKPSNIFFFGTSGPILLELVFLNLPNILSSFKAQESDQNVMVLLFVLCNLLL